MWISISEASRNWGISRTTIHAKIKQKILSKGENGLLDPAEISRVFGSPKIKPKNLHNVQNKENTLHSTLKELFEKQLDYERKLREQAEKRADEYKEKLTQAEKRLDEVLQQMNNFDRYRQTFTSTTTKKVFGDFLNFNLG